jgi:hypothetical protein
MAAAYARRPRLMRIKRAHVGRAWGVSLACGYFIVSPHPAGSPAGFFDNGQDRGPIFGLFNEAVDTYPCYIRHRSI